MSSKSKLKLIPLGGVDEIGKNMYVVEYGEDMIVIDCGLIFPKEDMLGIDLVIPDVTYLQKNQDKLRAFVFTHGHEDHIGATPYILKQFSVPSYGTRLTMALVEQKLKENRVSQQQAPLRVVEPGDIIELGKLSVQFIKVNHSIAGAVALAIHTPEGVIIHTGDFKIDYTPVDGGVIDLNALAILGSKGVLALMSDSTNVERPGYTMSERKVAETFKNLFEHAKGRIFVAMFASNVHRIQMVIDAATRLGRRTCVVGRSMTQVTKIAVQLGEMAYEPGALVDVDDVDLLPDDQVVVLTTGSQGEPMAGLTRMAYSEHRKLTIKSTDLVIVSANPIPGNEKFISRVINQLYRSGAKVIYESIAEVHVSGHACREELKLMLTLVKPKYFIPVHGEYRHLCLHAALASEMGVPQENIVVPDLGDIIELDKHGIRKGGIAPTGSVLIDGLGIGDVGNVVLRDRKHLSQDGLIIVVMAIEKESGMLVSGPDVISRGFVYVREAEELIEGTKDVVRGVLANYDRVEQSDWAHIKNKVKDDLHKYLYDKLQRNPMVLPIIVEI
ncbi:MAG: ribonuclease J [Oscillospiraceae bacterium]|nr:ribonuclease J [Oscillospiraceae bacterium]